MAPTRLDRVHQVNFDMQMGEGVVVTGSSLPENDLLVWLRRLQGHVRLQRFGSEPPPGQALSTFEFPDEGFTAVVRRWSSGGTTGRTDATALIAPTARVPLPVALGLDSGFDWARAPKERSFPAWDAVSVEQIGHEQGQVLREPAKREPEMLRRALAQLFEAQDGPLTIVGCPDEQRIPLLWGLHRVAARVLMAGGVRRSWTFSTYEVDDGASIPHLPSIVFLPDRRVAPGYSDRTLVDVRRDQPVSERSARRAATRVELFLADREDEPEVDETPRSPVPYSEYVNRTKADSAGAAMSYDEFMGRTKPNPVAAAPEPVPRGRYERTGADRSSQPTVTPVRGEKARPDLAAAVEQLRSAAGSTGLLAALNDLERIVVSAGDRAALREVLPADRYVRISYDVARALREEGDQIHFFRRVQGVTTGTDRGDLRHAPTADWALRIVELAPTPALGTTVLADLTTIYGPEPVYQNMARSWLSERGLRDGGLFETDDGSPVAPLTAGTEQAGDVPRRPERLFVSYAREDRPAADEIVRLLRVAGFPVWFDDDLRGGEEWWSEILGRIRESTVVVLVASDQARTSKPCQEELTYVTRLGLPVVPVRVGTIARLSTWWPVGQLQLVDFTAAGKEPTARLVGAVFAAAARWRTLPDPLPAEPDAPFAYLTRYRAELDRDDLVRQDLRRILDELREHLLAESDEDVRAEICDLLRRVGDHPAAVKIIERDVDRALADEAKRSSPG